MMQLFDGRLPNRFWDKVMPITECGCWLWIGAVDDLGYGRYHHNGVARLPHRVTTEYECDPVGTVRDHKCRISGCCNPAHTEAVTQLDNIKRGLKGVLTTHCPHGHPYNEDNTMLTPKGWRRCKICNRERVSRYTKQRRLADNV